MEDKNYDEFLHFFYGNCEEIVYVMYNNNTGLYKIGITNNIDRRLGQIRTQSGCDIDLLEFFYVCKFYDLTHKEIEKMIHNKYKKNRIVGEWFKFNDDELTDCVGDIDNLCEYGRYEGRY